MVIFRLSYCLVKIPHTKLPELIDADDLEVRDHNAELKERGKMYSDKYCTPIETDIHADDQVLVKQDCEYIKLSGLFNISPFKVVEINCNRAVVESGEGVHYKRNVKHYTFDEI